MRDEGLDAHFVQIDLRDGASIAAAAARIEREHGHLDILINNAGVSLNTGVPPSVTDIALLRETYETNVFDLVAMSPPAEGAVGAIRLALIEPDGPTGGFYGDQGQIPW